MQVKVLFFYVIRSLSIWIFSLLIHKVWCFTRVYGALAINFIMVSQPAHRKESIASKYKIMPACTLGLKCFL